MKLPSDFSDSTPAENAAYTIDFVYDLPAGNTIASAVWQLIDPSGVDKNTASRLVGSPVIVGTKVQQTMTGLLSGVNYVTRALATTSQGNVISLFAHVRSV